MATFNEFQRELQKRGIDPQNAYMFTLIYERLIQTEKMVTEAMTVLEALANSVKGVVDLHESTQKRVQDLIRGQHANDALVGSVAFDPDKDNKH